mgnify:CR=1 FL=1
MVKQVKKVSKVQKVKLKKIEKKRTKTSYRAVVRGRDNVAGRDIKQFFHMPTISESGRSVDNPISARNFAQASARSKTALELGSSPSTWDNPPAFSSPHSLWSRPSSHINFTLPSSQFGNPQVGSTKTGDDQRDDQTDRRRRPYFRGSKKDYGNVLPVGNPTGWSETESDDGEGLQLRRKPQSVAPSRAVSEAESMSAIRAPPSVLAAAAEARKPLRKIKIIKKPKMTVSEKVNVQEAALTPPPPIAEAEIESSGWSDEKSYRRPAERTWKKWVQQGHDWKDKPIGTRNTSLKKWNYKKGKWDYKRGDKRR